MRKTLSQRQKVYEKLDTKEIKVVCGGSVYTAQWAISEKNQTGGAGVGRGLTC